MPANFESESKNQAQAQSIALEAPRSANALHALRQGAVIFSATIFMALCAHVSLPLVFSPVPLTLQTFGLLVVALLLGSKRAPVAMALYLMEGAAGLPVFSPTGPGGVAQLLGPTGGFLLMYPLAALVAARIFEQLRKTYVAALLSSIAAELLVLTSGMLWLKMVSQQSFTAVFFMAVLPFLPGETLKVISASALAAWRERKQPWR